MIKLQSISTRAPQELQKSVIKKKTESLLSQLQELQALLFAEKKHSILIVLQGLDASGKDGAVQHVFSSVNPMGCKVKAFKVPTEEEMAHDFLWRIHQHAPEKGMIQIFNRSHYEDVLVPGVHDCIGKDEIKRRYEHINAWELLIQDSGTHLLKFYLHISKEEQAIRFNERLSIPEKRWKYKESDIEESKLWDKYQIAFEDIFKSCDKAAPWTIVPSDQNWYKDYLIASAIVEELLSLKMKYPELSKET